MQEKIQHFSIRKLSVGAASVLIGVSFFGVKGQTVHADTADATSDNTEQQDRNTQKAPAKPAQVVQHVAGSRVDQTSDANSSNISKQTANATDKSANNVATKSVQAVTNKVVQVANKQTTKVAPVLRQKVEANTSPQNAQNAASNLTQEKTTENGNGATRQEPTANSNATQKSLVNQQKAINNVAQNTTLTADKLAKTNHNLDLKQLAVQKTENETTTDYSKIVKVNNVTADVTSTDAGGRLYHYASDITINDPSKIGQDKSLYFTFNPMNGNQFMNDYLKHTDPRVQLVGQKQNDAIVNLSSFNGGYKLALTDKAKDLADLQLHLDLYWREPKSAQVSHSLQNNGSLYTKGDVNNYTTKLQALKNDINIGVGSDVNGNQITDYHQLYRGDSGIARTVTVIPNDAKISQSVNSNIDLIWEAPNRDWYNDHGVSKVHFFKTKFSVGPTVGPQMGQRGKIIMDLPYNTDLFEYRTASSDDSDQPVDIDVTNTAQAIKTLADELKWSLSRYAYTSTDSTAELTSPFTNNGVQYATNFDFKGGKLIDPSHITTSGRDLGSKDGHLYFELDYNVDRPVTWAAVNPYKNNDGSFVKQAPILEIYDKTPEAQTLPKDINSYDQDKVITDGSYHGPKLANQNVESWLANNPYQYLLLGQNYTPSSSYQSSDVHDGDYKLIIGSGDLLTDFLRQHTGQDWGQQTKSIWDVDAPRLKSGDVPDSAVTVKEAHQIDTNEVSIIYVDASSSNLIEPHTNVLTRNMKPNILFGYAHTLKKVNSYNLTDAENRQFNPKDMVSSVKTIANNYNSHGIPENWQAVVDSEGNNAYGYVERTTRITSEGDLSRENHHYFICVPIVHKQVCVTSENDDNTINATYIINNPVPAKYRTSDTIDKNVITLQAKRDEWQDLVDNSHSFGDWQILGIPNYTPTLTSKDGVFDFNSDYNKNLLSVKTIPPIHDSNNANAWGVSPKAENDPDFTGLVREGRNVNLTGNVTSVNLVPDFSVLKNLSVNNLRKVMPGGVINVTYTPFEKNRQVVFVDDTNQQQVGQPHNFKGKTDEVLHNLNLAVPEHYQLAPNNNLPAQISFETQKGKDGNYYLDLSPITVHLVHKIDPVTDPAAINREVKRTVIIHEPEQKPKTTVQSVEFARTGTRDEVTDKTTYTSWQAQGSDTFDALTVPTVKGYNPSSTVDQQKATPDMGDFTLDITYRPVSQTFNVNYVSNIDKHTIVKSILQKGKTDETINIDYGSVPVGWIVTPGQAKPATRKIDASINPDITIYIDHDFSKDENPDTKTVTRIVNLVDENGNKTQLAKQTHTFTRDSFTDMVDHQTKKYGNWSDSGQFVFDEVNAPAKHGYSINGSAPKITVTPRDKDSEIDLNYVANGQTSYWQFKDINKTPGKIAIDQKHNIAGKTGQTVSLDIISQIPAGYKLADGQTAPTSYTFKDHNNKPLIIKLDHQTRDISGDSHYDVKRTVSRTIHVIKPGQKETKQDESVVFTRGGTKDLVTGQVQYGHWNKDQQVLPGLNVDTVAGYTPDKTVPDITVTPDSRHSEIYVTYSPNKQTSQIVYLDKDKQNKEVTNAPLVGKTDQTINVTVNVPKNYKIAKEQNIPKQYTFKAKDNTPVTIYLEHAKQTIDHKHPTGEKGLTQKDLNQTIGRIITLNKPDKTRDIVKQTENIYRDAIKDLVTGNITYTDWTIPTKTLPKYTTPKITGYEPDTKDLPAIAATPDMDIKRVTISYTATNGKQTIHYVDPKHNPVSQQTIAGTIGQNVPFTPNIPDGWVLKDRVPKTLPIKDKNTPITYVIDHGHKIVTPDKPHKPGDPVPGFKHVKYPNGVDQNDLNKNITRTIEITKPDGSKRTVVQKVAVGRSGDVDLVTGKVTYSKWNYTTNKHDFDEYDLPAKPNYKIVIDGQIGNKVKRETVDPNGQNQTVKVVYQIINENIPVPHTKPVKPGDVLPGTDVPAPKGVADHDLNQTVTRTIILDKPTGQQKVVQTAHIHRDATVNVITGKITYTPWTSDETYPGFAIPQVQGYRSQVDGKNSKQIAQAKPLNRNETIVVKYVKIAENKPVIHKSAEHKPAETAAPSVPVATPETWQTGGQINLPDLGDDYLNLTEKMCGKITDKAIIDGFDYGEKNINSSKQAINRRTGTRLGDAGNNQRDQRTMQTAQKTWQRHNYDDANRVNSSNNANQLPQTGNTNDIAVVALGLAAIGLSFGLTRLRKH